jgi:type I restriction enzyme S subunit
VYVYPDLMMRLRFQEESTAQWFWRYANSANGRRFFVAVAAGSAGSMPKISGEKLRGMRLPVPPLHERRAIAAALSDVDALLEGLTTLIAKKRDLKQAAMQQLLTGQVRLAGFGKEKGHKRTEVGLIPQDWTLEYIEHLAHITTGGKNTQDREDDGRYPFFVRSQTVERINSYSFDGEAVLTAGDGVGTGKVFHYINGKCDVHQRVYRICEFSDRLNARFFYFYFSTSFYRRIMQMTAKSSVDSVRREMIARMLVPLPATKDEQDAIAAVLSDMDAELAALEARREKTRALKQAMMQELLTGKTRLVAPASASEAAC